MMRLGHGPASIKLRSLVRSDWTGSRYRATMKVQHLTSFAILRDSFASLNRNAESTMHIRTESVDRQALPRIATRPPNLD